MQLEVRDLWNKCLSIIKNDISEQSFATWFAPIVPLKFQNNTLTIQVPSQFFYEWLEEKHVSDLRKAIDQTIGRQGMLEYSIVVDKGDRKNPPITFNLPPTNQAQNQYSKPSNFPNPAKSPFELKNLDSLDTFPDKFVLYVSTEKFTNQFVNAIRNNSIEAFTNFYLQVDVLIIDDVQFLSGKEKTQETFFNIFNHLHQSGKQIILSSDRAPRDLAGMEDRLLSRFKWGLTADLQQPDFETRIAIIQKKLQEDGIQIDFDVLEYLAHSIQTNVRELEGVIISLMAQASLTRKEIDLELAKSTLKSIVNEQEKELSVESILDVVTNHFDVDLDTLRGKCRKKENVFPRQIAMYMLKELTNLPLKSIGYHFGGRDHSTVIHAVQAVSEAMETDQSVEKTIRNLFTRFNLKGVQS